MSQKFPQSMWSEEPGITKVLFKHLEKIVMGSTMYYITNENMTKGTFINNSIFLGCLYSKGVVLHVHLGF